MKNILVLVGPPGCGKSTLAVSYEAKGYERISQDDQGKEGHLERFKEVLALGKDIVLDRMNFSKDQRSRYLIPAKEQGYRTVIQVLHQPRAVCLERMKMRSDHPTVKDEKSANSALNTFFSKYERPTKVEADELVFTYPEGEKELAVICDLDGTMCNIDHRLKFIHPEPYAKKDWKQFFQHLKDDTPNQWCASIIQEMSNNYRIVYASGRPDDYKLNTANWLERHDLDYGPLYMRCRGDFRADTVAKEIILDFELLTRYKPLFFIDDRKTVVDLWRRRGYTCLHCAEGNF